ncbi:MAG: hypothetical protein ABSF95_17420 [Verrucomicrobiota bacterium]
MLHLQLGPFLGFRVVNVLPKHDRRAHDYRDGTAYCHPASEGHHAKKIDPTTHDVTRRSFARSLAARRKAV